MAQLVAGVGSPGTVGAANGGKVYAYNNVSTTPMVVAPPAPQRQSINFHNPGTEDVFVFPTYVQTTGKDVPLAPNPSALGGCYRVFANGGDRPVVGECQQEWNAFTLSGVANPLTVTDSWV